MSDDVQPTEVETDLRQAKRPKTAAGARSIVSTFSHMRDEGHGLASAVKILGEMNQVDGFDCPGCAWPDPDDRAALTEFCENGAKAAAAASTRKSVGAEFFEKHAISELRTQTDHWLGQQGRLVQPMVRAPGSDHYAPIDWEDAFSLVATRLKALQSPNEAVFYTSGRTSNEAAFLYQLFCRAFGTNNLPDCSNMCHESSGVGLGQTVGIGKGSVTLEDFDHADTIVVIGQNPGTNHPRMMTALQGAKSRGATIIAINPLPETGLMRFAHPQKPLQMLTGGTPLADLFLQVNIGGDIALLKALMVLLVDASADRDVVDRDFIEEHTEGFEALLADLKQQDLIELCEQSGGTGGECSSGRRHTREQTQHHCVLGDGVDTTQARRRQRP